MSECEKDETRLPMRNESSTLASVRKRTQGSEEKGEVKRSEIDSRVITEHVVRMVKNNKKNGRKFACKCPCKKHVIRVVAVGGGIEDDGRGQQGPSDFFGPGKDANQIVLKHNHDDDGGGGGGGRLGGWKLEDGRLELDPLEGGTPEDPVVPGLKGDGLETNGPLRRGDPLTYELRCGPAPPLGPGAAYECRFN